MQLHEMIERDEEENPDNYYEEADQDVNEEEEAISNPCSEE
jgi:hypothetical protein